MMYFIEKETIKVHGCGVYIWTTMLGVFMGGTSQRVMSVVESHSDSTYFLASPAIEIQQERMGEEVFKLMNKSKEQELNLSGS